VALPQNQASVLQRSLILWQSHKIWKRANKSQKINFKHTTKLAGYLKSDKLKKI
jgi:hypothetical protein